MLQRGPVASMDYPGSYGDLLRWFPDDVACLDYLDWLRWPEGFRCPRCASTTGWRLTDGRWSCGGCAHRASPTAGTIFHGTRTPLTVWFAAAWHMTSEKNGISALGLKRQLGIGSEQTAWAMLHRYRTAMVRRGRDRLSGSVEVDETVLGGPEPGKPGRGALGKTLVEVGIERTGRSFGRCRLEVIEDASAEVLRRFLVDHVEPGSTVVSDGWGSYPGACGDDYVHERYVVSGSGSKAHVLLPGVHLVASLAKRWLMGT
ncbi:MAG: IS1595 family transposase, partial [Actinomycetota bacterium]|nr:IS1595 family transposase [Actinomycetota bacterium]